MATLYIVGTPIGNLEDISLRALRVLSEADFILCEDTRVTKKLLEYYKIGTSVIACHHHSSEGEIGRVLDLIAAGKNLALVSDAGTPGISDPGGKLVAAALDRFGGEIRIESVPGPSAATAALSISGIPTDKFVFFGFPPHKKGRRKFLRKAIESEFPAVIYESKHRILRFFDELKEEAEKIIREREKDLSRKNRPLVADYRSLITSVVVCREISKMHETVYRGDLETIAKKISESQNDQKGEFTVIIGK